MPTEEFPDPGIYTVICRWRPLEVQEAGPEKLAALLISGCLDAQDAANNACLYLIWDWQGTAEALLVIGGKPECSVPDAGCFDTEEFGENITFSGKILSCHKLGGIWKHSLPARD